MKEPRYVVVDERSLCGNSVFFWCWDGRGYTVDLRMAAIMTESEAKSITNNRVTDKMYLYSSILKLVQHHVDMQDLSKIGERVFSHVYDHLNTNEDIELRDEEIPDEN
ncbi:MAG: hypothetical protein KAQ85_00825 [Thermodesulfovibrionia bacterium]|nr:hypothetical protein [Thermodesulfovibrionia bacterium]